MLKLLKFELIHSYRSFALVFVIFLMGCAALPLFPLDVFAIASVLLVFATFGITIAVFVTIVRNYNSSMFKKPGYLTLTLPVSSHQIVISKIISALIWFTITGIVLGFGLFIMFLVLGLKSGAEIDFGMIFNAIAQQLKYLRFDDYLELFKLLVRGIIISITSVTGIYALVTIVQTKYTRKHKVVIAFVIYFIYSFILSLLTQNIFGINTNLYPYIEDVLFNVTTLINIVQFVVYYFITIYVLDYKLELE